MNEISRWARATLVVLFLRSVLVAGDVALAAPPGLPSAGPEAVGMDSARLVHIDTAVEQALKRGRMPGCVVMIGRQVNGTGLNGTGTGPVYINNWTCPRFRPRLVLQQKIVAGLCRNQTKTEGRMILRKII